MPGLDWEEWVEEEGRRRRALAIQVISLICIGVLIYYHPLINSLLGRPMGLVAILTASIAYTPTLATSPPESVLVGVIGYLLVFLIAWTVSITSFGFGA